MQILRFTGANGSAYTIVDVSLGAVLLTSVTGSNWVWDSPPVVASEGGGYYSITGVVTTNEPSGPVALWAGLTPNTSLSYVGDGASSIYLRRVDLRSANDGVGLPAYQRVVDANTYDTVGLPLYRKPDGVDDWMQTGAVDFSGTDKVTIAAGVRKLSDASTAIFAELSQSAGSFNGSFYLGVPAQAGAAKAQFLAFGTSQSYAATLAAELSAPMSFVLFGHADISSDTVVLRVNGKATSTSSSDLGAGTFGNHSLYFDRRGGTSLPFSGRDYGTIIVGRLLTGPETAAVEKLLRSKSRAY